MHAYKSGNVHAKDMSDEEALHYAEINNIGAGLTEPTADGQLVAEAMLDAPADIDEDIPAPPPPVEATPKTPKGKGARSRGKQSLAESEIAPASATIVPPGSARGAAAAATPILDSTAAQKRKRATKKNADEPVNSIEKEDTLPAEKKQRKKKA